jgi:hypothetical protein
MLSHGHIVSHQPKNRTIENSRVFYREVFVGYAEKLHLYPYNIVIFLQCLPQRSKLGAGLHDTQKLHNLQIVS